MEQFSLEKYLENPSRKVVTRDGREVIIEKTDIHIHGMSHMILGKYSDIYEIWNSNGRINYTGSDCNLDLFFTDEEELTEFEKAVRNILVRYISNVDDFPETIKSEAKSLLDLARKELKSELDKKLKEAYNQGGLDTQEEITKCLPKWKKIPSGIQGNNKLEPTYLIRTNYGFYFTSSCLSGSENNMYIELKDLKTLPKEE